MNCYLVKPEQVHFIKKSYIKDAGYSKVLGCLVRSAYNNYLKGCREINQR